jgi:hypothetical protein
MPVGNRTGLNGVYGSSNEVGDYVFIESVTRHRVPLGAKELRVCWSGFHVDLNRTEFPARPRAASLCDVAPTCGGAGYAVGDVVTLMAPGELTPARVMVIEARAGAVTQLSILDPGLFAEVPADEALTIAGGHGYGLACAPRWTALAAGGYVGLDAVRQGSGIGTVSTARPRPAVFRTPVGGIAISEAIGFDLPAGSQIELHHCGTYGGSGRLTMAGREFASGRTNVGIPSESVPIAPRMEAAPFTQPLCLLGRPLVEGSALAILGDGIANGSTGVGRDIVNAEGYIGWAEKALADTVAWSNFSCDGDSLARWVGASGHRGMRLDAICRLGFNAVLLCLCLNDFTLGWSLEDIVSAERELVADLRMRGITQIIGVTTPPATASIDNWTTTEGQSPTSISDAINRRNRMLRDVCYPVDFDVVWDVAAVCEAPGIPGTWAERLTDDGYHPNIDGHDFIAKYFRKQKAQKHA